MRETLPWGGHHIYDRLVARQLQRFYDQLALGVRANDILDLGCGPGHLAAAIAQAQPDASVCGMDLDPVQVRLADRHAAPNLRYAVGASHAIPLDDESQDWVLATETFHHWKHPRRSLAEIARVLRPGGQLWIVEGAGDMTRDEFEAWTGKKPFPLLMVWVRAVFRRHGYTTKKLHRVVIPLLEASAFDAAIERVHGWWVIRCQATS